MSADKIDDTTERAGQEPGGGTAAPAAKPAAHGRPGLLRRFRPLIVALLVAVALLGAAGYYAYGRDDGIQGSGQVFDPNSVLPAPVSQPENSTVYTAESIKQYDGKEGRKCYVAVKDSVYEIKDNAYWQNGQHTPSNGQGMCGGDMTEAIKKSPHGESYLERLPKVGVFE